MEETEEDLGSEVPGAPNASSWPPSDFMEKLQSVSLVSQEEILKNRESRSKHEVEGLASEEASQIFWATGKLSEVIPNGFYSVIPEKRLKDLFDTIPSLNELYALDLEDVRADVILVDAEKDKKLSMLKQLIVTLVKGLNSNPTAMIKKIVALVCDFYKHPNSEPTPPKSLPEKISHASDNQGIQMLGQIRQGSSRSRAILFKVLADTVGLDSTLMVGLPREQGLEQTDSYKHISVLVRMNSVELLVDLMRFPGQMVPCLTKAIFMLHTPAMGESYFAENDCCDSPLEPNSPLCTFSERVDSEGSSHSEPNITNTFWRRSRKKVPAEQRTASSSPEHPLFRVHRQSTLGGDKHLLRAYTSDVAASRSVGASTSATCRRRRRCVSITPEIGDDIVRAVRAMNQTLKQNRLLREKVDRSVSCSTSNKDSGSDTQENVSYLHSDDHDEMSSERATAHILRRLQYGSEKAMSLPSSPHGGQASQQSDPSYLVGDDDDMISRCNKVLDLSKILNKSLEPFQEWNIDFSELTVGTRVGIGFFGEVFRGIWNGTNVAIKIFLGQDLTIENIEDFCNEISILIRLRHPNVILFLGACMKPPHLSMITEYMEMGSLHYLIHASGQKRKLSWRRRLKMLCDICRGLMCIHRMKMVHRDLKSANCLVDKHLTVKICDFGLSRILTMTPMRDTSSAGTPEWMAPELIRNEPFTEKCDIFSLGVIIWELCTLTRPWEGVPSAQVIYAVANDGLRLEIPEGPLGKLIADCWVEPDERPSCDEILSRLLYYEYTIP